MVEKFLGVFTVCKTGTKKINEINLNKFIRFGG